MKRYPVDVSPVVSLPVLSDFRVNQNRALLPMLGISMVSWPHGRSPGAVWTVVSQPDAKGWPVEERANADSDVGSSCMAQDAFITPGISRRG